MKTILKKLVVIMMAAIMVTAASGANTVKAATVYDFTLCDGAVTFSYAPHFNFYSCCWHYDSDDSTCAYEIVDNDTVGSVDATLTGTSCNCNACVKIYDTEGNLIETATITGFCILPGQTYLGNPGEMLWTVNEVVAE